jgi:hypothetical protein
MNAARTLRFSATVLAAVLSQYFVRALSISSRDRKLLLKLP